jgi:hypothetical protein
MRWCRAATIGLTAFALLALAQPASAVTYVGLDDLTCDGATTMGTGMPERTRLDVALVDPASDRTLSRGRITTTTAGTFEWQAKVSLSGMRAVRAVVRTPGKATPLAWVEHSLARSCPLASTGPNRTLPLVGVGLSSFTLGVLVLIAFAYQGRHTAPGGRHLAAPAGPHCDKSAGVPACSPTRRSTTSARSGSWSCPATWTSGRRPPWWRSWTAPHRDAFGARHDERPDRYLGEAGSHDDAGPGVTAVRFVTYLKPPTAPHRRPAASPRLPLQGGGGRLTRRAALRRAGGRRSGAAGHA